MLTLSKTARQLISFLLLMMLVLQGITQVSAEALPQAHMEEHCAGHASEQDCSCCSAGMMMTGGCAALCSVSIALSGAEMSVPRLDADGHQRLVVQVAFGPAYLPLNPPPIS